MTIHTAKGVLTINNDRGLHSRPSTELVKCALQFKSEIKLYYQANLVDGKSLLEILMLAAGKGSKIEIEATGIDAEEAVAAIIQLAANNFNTKY